MQDAFSAWATQLIATFKAIVGGMGGGISDFVKTVFFETGTNNTITGLSTVGAFTAFTAGIAGAMAIVRWGLRWATSLGN